MVFFKKIKPWSTLSFIAFLHWSVPVFGQSLEDLDENYTGTFQVLDYQGDAEFVYKVVEGDTILNGPFQLQKNNLSDLLSKQDKYFSFKGNFEDNSPTGLWKFKFGEFGAAKGTEVIDYQYQVKVDGEQHDAAGAIVKGKPDGQWTHTVQRIERSKVAETLFKSSIQFNNGIPQKAFQIQNEQMTLIGRFLRGGLAHDIWELYSITSPDAIERWYFKEGRLEQVLFQNKEDNPSLQAYPNTIDNPKEINLDSKYLQIIRLLQQLGTDTDGQIVLESGMNSLLRQNANYYEKIDKILSDLGESAFTPEFKVMVAHYPLSDKEARQLQSIKNYYSQSETISNSLLKSTTLNIIKLADEFVLYELSTLRTLREQYLPFIGQMIQYHEEGVLEYIPRDNMVPKLWNQGALDTSIEVKYEGSEGLVIKTYVGPNADSYKFDSPGLEALLQLAGYLYNSIESIHAEVNDKLKKKERQEELKSLEEELITSATKFNELADSLRNEVSGPYSNTLKNIKSNVKQVLSEYSAMEDLAIKPDRARQLTTCFGQMGELSLIIAQLPVKKGEIKKEYTDRVWNPFTATVMDEEVKKRITDAYKAVLIPHLLDEVKNKPFL